MAFDEKCHNLKYSAKQRPSVHVLRDKQLTRLVNEDCNPGLCGDAALSDDKLVGRSHQILARTHVLGLACASDGKEAQGDEWCKVWHPSFH